MVGWGSDKKAYEMETQDISSNINHNHNNNKIGVGEEVPMKPTHQSHVFKGDKLK